MALMLIVGFTGGDGGGCGDSVSDKDSNSDSMTIKIIVMEIHQIIWPYVINFQSYHPR